MKCNLQQHGCHVFDCDIRGGRGVVADVGGRRGGGGSRRARSLQGTKGGGGAGAAPPAPAPPPPIKALSPIWVRAGGGIACRISAAGGWGAVGPSLP